MRAVEDQGIVMSMSKTVEIKTMNVNKVILEVKYSIITYLTVIQTFNWQNIGKDCNKGSEILVGWKHNPQLYKKMESVFKTRAPDKGAK